MKRPSYSKEQHAKAKAEQKTLVMIDIDTRYHADPKKRGRLTVSGLVDDATEKKVGRAFYAVLHQLASKKSEGK